MATSILVVEDDRNIAELLQLYLEKEGYAVTLAYDGAQGLSKFHTIGPDLVLLDVMMPIMNGWELCKAIRAESQTPIIMLTAKSQTEDKAVLRRSNNPCQETKARRLTFDKLIIDMDSFELTVDGKKVDTPPKEMELLYFLASAPNRVYTRNQLLDEVWGFDYYGDSRTVDVHVKRLREKLEGVSDQWGLLTVWGVGYKFGVNQ